MSVFALFPIIPPIKSPAALIFPFIFTLFIVDFSSVEAR